MRNIGINLKNVKSKFDLEPETLNTTSKHESYKNLFSNLKHEFEKY